MTYTNTALSYYIKQVLLSFTGTKHEMTRLEQLFMEEKFHPLDDDLKLVAELLLFPLNKELKKHKRKQGICMLMHTGHTHITKPYVDAKQRRR